MPMEPLDAAGPRTTDPEPVHLSEETMARLRQAGGWARFVAGGVAGSGPLGEGASAGVCEEPYLAGMRG